MFLSLNFLRIYISQYLSQQLRLKLLWIYFLRVCAYVCVVFSRFMITSEASCVPFMKTTASSTSLSVPGTARTGTATLRLTFIRLCTCEDYIPPYDSILTY